MQQAVCVRRKKTKKKTKPRRTFNTPRNPQQPGDRDHLEKAYGETRPTPSPYLPASRDPGFVEIGLVQLSQSVKTTNVTRTHRQTNGIMAPCTHPGTSRQVNEARRPHTCSRPCALEEKKKGKKRNSAARKTHHEIHSNPATETTSRRRATKHVPRTSPY